MEFDSSRRAARRGVLIKLLDICFFSSGAYHTSISIHFC